MINRALPKNFIQFVGTAGARFVTIDQSRSSAGIWISYEGTNILIDPGPGSLVRCLNSNPKLDPSLLDAIILTHKHIDHSNDVNIMIEAMTAGGSKKRGLVFLPDDMMSGDSILLKYVRQLPEEIIILKEHSEYAVGNLKFSTPLRHIHSVETYGLKFAFKDKTISFIVDTRYFDKIISCYKADILVINTVFIRSIPNIDHLSIEDAGHIISQIKPRQAILTHFGRDIIKEEPSRFSCELSKKYGTEVLAADDGMIVEL